MWLFPDWNPKGPWATASPDLRSDVLFPVVIYAAVFVCGLAPGSEVGSV